MVDMISSNIPFKKENEKVMNFRLKEINFIFSVPIEYIGASDTPPRNINFSINKSYAMKENWEVLENMIIDFIFDSQKLKNGGQNGGQNEQA